MRHRAREVAFHLLFESAYRREDFGDGLSDEFARYFMLHPRLDKETERFMEHLVRGVLDREERLDRYIEEAGPNWKLERIGRTERTLLRLALFELLSTDQNGEVTPPEIVIDEAVELAKMYGADESPRFVNGVLDAARRLIEQRGESGS